MRTSKLAFAIAVVAGTLLWATTSMISNKVEPWDAAGYWTVAYPLAIGIAGFLGYLAPERPWRWALVIMFTQVIVMVAGGSGLGLLPLGLILLAILSVPAVVVARFGAAVRIRRGDA